ncbi:MexX/AxyX family multidrug efflux RND transporter periplasmic adaptor subunit [Oligoflexus tunisiensis]|uniref:MexX/AxyX family multidrug efflux RND transporter periplasmic adaptor subunit n=1 Tax=Oligoflexus tunisiensis TaxID=708132 RepID=UPI000B18B190|nr:MexX/AxyX family multidrug efflux RND transporter periplasmic adaptor subunit [Oligoflexus tunisiensis]
MLRQLQIILAAAFLGAGIFIQNACKEKAAEAPPPAKPEVVIAIAERSSEPITTELPGRLEAFRQAEVRARVAGIITARLYQEGQQVKKGTRLFRIDPAPLRAAYNMATGQLESAKANHAAAADKLNRYKELRADKAVSEMEYTAAVAEEAQARAAVVSAEASQESARLQLSYANVTAPIDGRARRAMVTEGALVGLDTPTPLTIVEQIDPIYVNFAQPAADVLDMRRGIETGQLERIPQSEVTVHIILPDGTEYDQPGQLLFSDLAVDPNTDTVTMRAVFPNPKEELLPGTFVSVRMVRAVNKATVLVPRDALIRGLNSATVMVVNGQDKVEALTVKADTIKGPNWLVTQGLKGGERIILTNPSRMVAGTEVKPIPMSAPVARDQPATTPSSTIKR